MKKLKEIGADILSIMLLLGLIVFLGYGVNIQTLLGCFIGVIFVLLVVRIEDRGFKAPFCLGGKN